MKNQALETQIGFLESQLQKHRQEMGTMQKEKEDCTVILQNLKTALAAEADEKSGDDNPLIRRHLKKMQKEMRFLKNQVRLIQDDVTEICEMIKEIFPLLKKDPTSGSETLTKPHRLTNIDGPTFRDLQEATCLKSKTSALGKQTPHTFKPTGMPFPPVNKGTGSARFRSYHQTHTDDIPKTMTTKTEPPKSDSSAGEEKRKTSASFPFFRLKVESE